MMFIARPAAAMIYTLFTLWCSVHVVKADCERDQAKLAINQDLRMAILNFFTECMGDVLNGDECDTSNFAKACEKAGGDYFTFNGALTCDDDDDEGGPGIMMRYEDAPACLPPSCTEDESTLSQYIMDNSGLDGYTNCGFSLDFDGIGTTSDAGFSINTTMTGRAALTLLIATSAVAMTLV